MTTHYDDETLMAFADGRLDEPLFSEIADAVEADLAIAERVERLALGARLVKETYGPLIDAPIPATLLHRIEDMARSEGSNVVPLRPRRSALPWQPMAAAAVIAFVIAGPLGYLAGTQGTAAAIAVGEPLTGDVATLIDTLPSGEARRAGNGTVRPIATFKDGDGALCREFEFDSTTATVAVACRAADQWRVAFAVNAPLGGDGYAPATSLESLDAYLTATEAGAPYDVAAEADVLRSMAN